VGRAKIKKQPVVVQVQNEANFYQIAQPLAKLHLAEKGHRPKHRSAARRDPIGALQPHAPKSNSSMARIEPPGRRPTQGAVINS
jgi:hypothetical protein